MGKFLAKKGSNNMKKCAFCANWYDPLNEAIAPKKGMSDHWEYSSGIKKPCTKKANTLMPSHSYCSMFRCKL